MSAGPGREPVMGGNIRQSRRFVSGIVEIGNGEIRDSVSNQQLDYSGGVRVQQHLTFAHFGLLE